MLSKAPMFNRRTWLRGALIGGVTLHRGVAAAAPAPVASANAGRSVVAPAVRANLSLNESPFGPSPSAVQAIRDGLGRLERYTDEEASALTRQIASLEQVAPEQVLLGDILEPLGLHLGLEGGPGGEFVFSQPGYGALVEAAESVGGVAVPVPLDAKLENDLPALRAKVNARTRSVFLVNPHNPSGTVTDPSSFQALVAELARKTLVIVDEAYLEYTERFAESTVVGQARAGANVVVFRTFSKIHGLAALPFGYAVVPPKLGELLRRRGVGQPRTLNRLAIVAAAASLRDAAHATDVRRRVAAERLRYAASVANFVFFETGQPQGKLAEALRARGVVIGRAFPPLDRWARITIGLPEENAIAQSALREVLG